MDEITFEELLNALRSLGLGVERGHLESLKDAGVLRELLEKAGEWGSTPQGEGEIISQINRLTEGFSRERREQIGRLFLELARRLGWEELPSGFMDFLEHWKRGG
ncbi:MAG: hypothetical protein ACPLTR_01080 [Thermacetogeniaceae bacterium]